MDSFVEGWIGEYFEFEERLRQLITPAEYCLIRATMLDASHCEQCCPH